MDVDAYANKIRKKPRMHLSFIDSQHCLGNTVEAMYLISCEFMTFLAENVGNTCT